MVFECFDAQLGTFRVQHDRERDVQLFADFFDEVNVLFVFFVIPV